ncbi:MAG TPA: beta-ketoacyl-[acyl-carrier-protein] synthase family protein [Solirubrobacterales bacterium]|nr:beta-ketoacyl-[acyl-carrier-protein] synthase family protein [Solirubrobacterales bacterium]
MRRAVVVTGVGAMTPLGAGAPRLFSEWVAGRSGIAGGVGTCEELEPGDLLSVKEARRTERFAQLAIAACEEAVHGAGWGECVPFDPYRVACVLGTGMGGTAATLPNAAATAVATRYGLRGPSSAPASACAAGADAVAIGVRLIRSGEADAAVVGGAESPLGDAARAVLAATGMVSRTGVCRPFDARRDGFAISEGAAALVLESAAAARERGAAPLGRAIGVGTTCDAFDAIAPDPGAGAASRAIENALSDAGIGPGDVDYVNAHGTGTPLGDRAETRALKEALGDRAGAVPVTSAKSATGHALGAAGAVDAVATVIALAQGVAPPTLGHEVAEQGLDLDYAGDGPRALGSGRSSLVGISSTFALGGHNVVLAFEAGAPA